MEPVVLPPPLVATAADLAAPVASALDDPAPGGEATVLADGIRFFTRSWGDAEAPPVLLVHGVTSSSRTWWRVGPALAAAGYRVVAIDLPGHGRTGQWTGEHRFVATAARVAGFVEAAGLRAADLAVIGHSWGAMTAAALPVAGLVPRVLVLLDPPGMPRAVMAAMTTDPVEGHYDDLEEARTTLRRAYPDWTVGDVEAKAEGLVQFD